MYYILYYIYYIQEFDAGVIKKALEEEWGDDSVVKSLAAQE